MKKSKPSIDDVLGVRRDAPTPEMIKFNTQGLGVLNDLEILVIGDCVSERLQSMGLSGLSSRQGIERCMVDFNIILSGVIHDTFATLDGKAQSSELKGHSVAGKPLSFIDQCVRVGYELGLDVRSGDPESVKRFLALALRYHEVKFEV